jgi:hypothetical protein
MTGATIEIYHDLTLEVREKWCVTYSGEQGYIRPVGRYVTRSTAVRAARSAARKFGVSLYETTARGERTMIDVF